MTEQDIKTREPGLKKKGFVRVVFLKIVNLAFSLFFAIGSVSFFSAPPKLSFVWPGGIITAIASLYFLFIFWKDNYRPWRKFRRQMKKWFEAKEGIAGFLALVPMTNGFNIFAIRRSDYKDLKHILDSLRQANAAFVTAPYLGRWKYDVQDELSFLDAVRQEEGQRYKTELREAETRHRERINSIEEEKKLLNSSNYLNP